MLERSVFPYLGRENRRVVLGPGIGRDAAIIRFGNRNLVFSTDPITGAVKHIGRHAVHVNANDVAVAGATPLWFLCTLLVPPGTREKDLRSIMREIHTEASKLGISVIRGHSEATPVIKQVVVAGFMVGEGRTGSHVASNRGHVGDRVVMTKTAGIEGTAVLASDYARLLRRKGVDSRTIDEAEGFSRLLSIVRDAAVASKVAGVTAMHDPTEGGILNGLWELAVASRVGVEVLGDKIRVARETSIISKALGLDPLKLLSSGSLLITCRSDRTPNLISSLGRAGVAAVEIGRLTKNARTLLRNGRHEALTPISRDELYSVSVRPV